MTVKVKGGWVVLTKSGSPTLTRDNKTNRVCQPRLRRERPTLQDFKLEACFLIPGTLQ
ncbi:MAG: hypothetical protein PHT84_04200 [Candidatus Pacebacteria bacterium]|nr:hypothetical protein [Candidatus Paceibacterota bacterium]